MEALGKRRRGGKKDKGTPRVVKPPVPEEPQEELTQEDYEKQKIKILRRAVLIENQYNMLRTMLKEKKLKQAADYKKTVAEGRCPEFLLGRKEAEETFTKKNEINNAILDMKMAQILDEEEAEKQMNETQFDDQYAYSKGRFIDFFMDLIAEKRLREQQLGAIMGTLIALPPMPQEVSSRPLDSKLVYEGRTTRSRSMQKEKEEKERIAREQEDRRKNKKK